MVRANVARFVLIVSLASAVYGQRATEAVAEERRKVLKAIDQFSTAVGAYRAAVSSQASLDKPLKDMDAAISDVERRFRTPQVPKVNKGEYATLSRSALAAETLKTAELVKADLPAILKIYEDPNILMTPDVKAFLTELHGEVERLKFLISKTRSAREK